MDRRRTLRRRGLAASDGGGVGIERFAWVNDLAHHERAEQHGRGRVRRGIEPERDRQRRPQREHEQPRQRIADDVGQRLADPQRRVRGQQVSSCRTIWGTIATRAGRKKIEIDVRANTSG